MKHGSAEQAACVRHAIEQGGRDALPGVLAAIRDTGALDDTRRASRGAKRELARAARSRALPASTYKDSLLQLASFAVARDF